MQKISVVVPCYNDSSSVAKLRERLVRIFETELSRYDYEIIYVDDCSPDNTWEEIKKLCKVDKRVKGIHNSTNFGFSRNMFTTMKYGDGDATFMIFGDMQDPPELLPQFVQNWEAGHKIVVGARGNSHTNFFERFFRKIYYGFICRVNAGRIAGYSGFGLYDKSFINLIKGIDDIQPVIGGILAEYIKDVKVIQTIQEKGGRSKSNFNFIMRYDEAMISITSYSKSLLRMVTFIGAILGIFSVLYACFIFVYKILFWDAFAVGIPALTVGMFLLGAIQLFFLGVLGEYVLSINNRVMKRPIVVVDEKINFDEND